ncbi:ABC transporter ATP-binding protein [Crocinitomix catalasitica]|nr:ABC transporter ATP-binding protein [Crocinitomix catalasitica]
MLAIQTKSLSKFYGEHLGIKDINLEVQKGEIFGFIGPNGAGKSTTIRTLLGLLIPTSGEAKILGINAIDQGHQIREKIGYLPSEVNFYEDMTSREMLEYHSGFYKNVNRSKIAELAELFELDLEKPIADLSFGNKKKCGIIQSVLHNPEVLILDEPTSGLDPVIQHRFFELVDELNKDGVTVFFSSHVLSEVQRMCDRAAVIRSGEIATVEDIQTLLEKQMKKGRFVFTEIPGDLQFPKGIQHEKWHQNKLTFEYVGHIKHLTEWMASLDLVDAVLEEPDLETIFMNYYERE